MTGIDLVQLLSTTGATGVLAVAVWAFLTGKIIPKSTHDAIVADKDEQIAQAQQREAAVWNILQEMPGVVNYMATVTDRATRIGEALTQSEPPRWVATQAQIERRPRTRRPPKDATP